METSTPALWSPASVSSPFSSQTLGAVFPLTVQFTAMVSVPLLLQNIPFDAFLYFIIHCVLILAVTAGVFLFCLQDDF